MSTIGQRLAADWFDRTSKAFVVGGRQIRRVETHLSEAQLAELIDQGRHE